MTNHCETYKPTEENLEICAQLLQEGEVVGVPTETVYGLAGNALSEESARRIFTVKGRPLIDPLIVHFPNLAAACRHIQVNTAVEVLAEIFWPGPLTMVVQKQASIPDLVTAGLPSVAIRVPRHPTFRKLLQKLDFPLAAPSANPFGYVSPTLAEHVSKTLGERITAVIDGGPCLLGIESTIVDLRDPFQPGILRHGPITQEQLSQTLGNVVMDHTAGNIDVSPQTAPGQLTKHYSPIAEVHLFENGSYPKNLAEINKSSSQAVVFDRKPKSEALLNNTFWLSADGSSETVAHNLFELIQRLDQQGYKELHIELTDGTGIGKAINDRLSRAAAK